MTGSASELNASPSINATPSTDKTDPQRADHLGHSYTINENRNSISLSDVQQPKKTSFWKSSAKLIKNTFGAIADIARKTYILVKNFFKNLFNKSSNPPNVQPNVSADQSVNTPQTTIFAPGTPLPVKPNSDLALDKSSNPPNVQPNVTADQSVNTPQTTIFAPGTPLPVQPNSEIALQTGRQLIAGKGVKKNFEEVEGARGKLRMQYQVLHDSRRSSRMSIGPRLLKQHQDDPVDMTIIYPQILEYLDKKNGDAIFNAIAPLLTQSQLSDANISIIEGYAQKGVLVNVSNHGLGGMQLEIQWEGENLHLKISQNLMLQDMNNMGAEKPLGYFTVAREFIIPKKELETLVETDISNTPDEILPSMTAIETFSTIRDSL